MRIVGQIDPAELYAGAAFPETYPSMQTDGTTAKAGNPLRSPMGESFQAAVGPRFGTGLGLINDPKPIQTRHHVEMGFAGRSNMTVIAPEPIFPPGFYPGPMPVSEQPEVDVQNPWTISDAELGAIGR